MYIKDSFCISPQHTYNNEFFNNLVVEYAGNKYTCVKPNYKELININLLRRMGNANRTGVFAALSILNRNTEVDGFIVGTANGAIEQSAKFINQIFQYDEGHLTPTNFVQGTPNVVTGLLAQITNNTKYNITHVHRGLAFENCLIDALMLFKENKAKSLLVGNIEELSESNYNLEFNEGMYKMEEITSANLLESKTKGTVCGEGSAMFIFNAENINNYPRIIDVAQISYPKDDNEIRDVLQSFVNKNNLTTDDIDALVLGINGDVETDKYYYNIVDELFSDKSIYVFKNLVGEYPTVSAFATWLASNILQGKSIPKQAIFKINNPNPRTILVYNHYKGVQHGFILMST